MIDTQERVTATSISQMLNNVGQGVNIKITNIHDLLSNPKGELPDCQSDGG